MKHGKKYIEAAKNIERGNLYGNRRGYRSGKEDSSCQI